MNKVIKLVCSQTTANYRKPNAIDIQESYYLPPYSTVIGMIHNACGFDNYHDMKISVQGTYASSHTDMYTRYFFGIAYDPGRHQFFTTRDDDKKDGITKGLGYAETLVDINLVIHIACEDESLMRQVLEGLKKPKKYLSLGRHEDLLRIESAEIVEVENTDDVRLSMDAYIPLEVYNSAVESTETDSSGVVVKLNKVYEINKNVRNWQKVKVKYFTKGSKFLHDEDCKLLREKETKIGVFLA